MIPTPSEKRTRVGRGVWGEGRGFEAPGPPPNKRITYFPSNCALIFRRRAFKRMKPVASACW